MTPLVAVVGPKGGRRRRSQPALAVVLLLAISIVLCLNHHQLAQACHRAYFGLCQEENIACECNRTHCDSLPLFDWPHEPALYLRFVSDKSGRRLERSELRAEPLPAGPMPTMEQSAELLLLRLESDRRAQQVSGFGGAFTDSACEVIMSLEEPLRRRLLEDYFGPAGLDYNMGRVPISGTDMSTRAYSYNDLPAGEEDLELRKFQLQEEDLKLKIPLIKQVNSMRAGRNLDELKLIAASWSPPGWMKSNLRLVQGRLRGNSSSGPYYDAYARYIVRFLAEYEQRQVRMWALTPQNEPHTPTRIAHIINFNSANFRPREMADYLANSLIPELLAANKTRDKLKLFIWDDTLDDMEHFEAAALESPVVRSYMAGTAIHWYSQGLRNKPYGLLYEMRRKVIPPEFSLISTEACFIGAPKPGEWIRGLKYARDIIENLRAGSVAWIDWNLALNMSGGPTWVGNLLDAPVLVDKQRQSYYKNPMYYALAHLTRFVQPNAFVLPSMLYRRNSSSTDPQAGWQPLEALDEVTAVAVELESGQSSPKFASGHRKLALVLLNRSGHRKRLQLGLGAACAAQAGLGPLSLDLERESITSLAFIC